MPLTLEATESEGYELHEEGEWYPGDLASIEETESEWGAGLKWIIHLDGELDPINDEPRETWGFCSQKLSPRSKLYGWLKGFGIQPDPGDHVNLEKLVGGQVQVMFETYNAFDSDGNPVVKEKVVKIRAAKATGKKKSAPVEDDLEAPF